MENHKKKIVDYIGKDVSDFILEHVDITSSKTFIVKTTNIFNIQNKNKETENIVNLSKINNIRFINKFFEEVNNQLNLDNYFICCTETIQSRRNRQKIRLIPLFRNIFYFFEFIFLRVFPKTLGFKKIYFIITRGRRRLLSKAEVLGRLVSCGFDIIDYKTINGILYIVSKKNKLPEFNKKASYGPLYSMPRVGKNGKIIYIYKFRTMHPYAEYLQKYIVDKHGYSESGKPKDDFRLTPWGKVFRRFWIDEVPQIINILKFDLKIVGIRPVSKFYYDSLPEDVKKMRIKHKPGCIPPYVALNRKSSVEGVIKAEVEYMLEKEQNIMLTDFKYFIKAIYNIIFKGKRSA